MNNRIKQLTIVLFMGLVLFYGLPLIAKIIPSDFGLLFFIMLLLILNPIYSFASSLLYTRSNGIKWYIPALIGILFTPTVFIFYNDSAGIYIIAYVVISIIGSVIGFVIHRKIRT